jgi:penicillin amidase
MGQFFATDGTRDLIHYRNLAGDDRGTGRAIRGRGRPAPPPDLKQLPPDDAPAVVRRVDVSPEWISKVHDYAAEHGIQTAGRASGPTTPKFSHAWVVGGHRTTTGSSVLVSDPQTPVRNPSMFYEFHVAGATFNARGIGVPGSPAILIGFNDSVAWGVTALGADQADLFRLKTDPARPNEYQFDGRWRKMDVGRETIRVRGGRAVDVTIRQTHIGPVVTPFCFARPDEGEVALKRIPLCEHDRETVQAAVPMMRARDVHGFAEAIKGWRFPSVNIVFGDRDGNIGYWTLAAIPLRSTTALDAGRAAHDGTATKHDWQDIVPYELLPHVINPNQQYLATANHRPIGSWYPIPLGIMTGSGGDTLRSWRLRERLQAKTTLSPEDVRDIHFDAVNPARREIVRAGLHLRDVLKRRLSADATLALEHLEPWYGGGASSRLESKGAEVAVHLNTFFRFVATDLAWVYGGGESGLAYFLKTLGARLDADPKADMNLLEQQFIDSSLATAWQRAKAEYGPDVSRWNERARQLVTRRTLGYYESLDGYPSLDHDFDVTLPSLVNLDGGTIQSQFAQSYTQYVPLHDPDQAQSILPIGASELPENLYRLSTHKLWGEGKLHAAPLSPPAVYKYGDGRQLLTRPRP